VNLVTRAQQAKWFKLVGVRIGNGTKNEDGTPGGIYPNGDEVQTVELWTPPNTWADTSIQSLNAILTEIDAGLPNGQRYSDSSKATDRAAWKVVERHCPGKPEGQCREIIRTWVKNGVLRSEPYDDPVRREEAKGLRLDVTKRPGAAC
jgi:hypothetical protein